jgi:hypothetical protein
MSLVTQQETRREGEQFVFSCWAYAASLGHSLWLQQTTTELITGAKINSRHHKTFQTVLESQPALLLLGQQLGPPLFPRQNRHLPHRLVIQLKSHRPSNQQYLLISQPRLRLLPRHSRLHHLSRRVEVYLQQ